MKKFIIFLMALTMSINSCLAESGFAIEEQQLNIQAEAKYQRKVMEIGYRILNANKIDKRMTFYYSTNKEANAVAYARSKQIAVYKGLFTFFDSDDELAAIMCHEIAHGIDFHRGLWKRFSMGSSTKSYEIKADKKALDLMVNAGYNPVALIVILNKFTGEPSWFERSVTHPAGSERLAYMYEYIYAKYPAYLADNEYKNNVYYQNFLLNSKEWRKTVKAKYQEQYMTPVNNSTKK